MASTNVYLLPSTLAILQDKFNVGFTLVHLILGVTGSFLNILLFSRRQFRTVSCCTYFLGSSVAMFLQLTFSSVTAMYAIYHPHPIYYISAYCKLWFYFHQSIAMMFRWMLAAACLDRYALSSSNARLRRFANVLIARRVVAGIVIMWIILPSPLFVLYDLKAGNCIIIYGYPGSLYNGIFTIVNTYAIPITVMIIGTILIRRNLVGKRERQQNLVQQQRLNDKERRQRRRDQQALLMLFAQIFIYTVITTPWTIFTVYNAVALNVQNKSADRLAIERLVNYLVGQIVLLFPTLSFYLFTLSSNMFRKELFNMLHSIVSCKVIFNHHRIEPSTQHISLRAPTVQGVTR